MGRLCYGSSSSSSSSTSSSGVVQVSSHHTPDWHRARPWMVPQNRFATRRCCFRLTPWSAIEWHSNGPRDTLHMTSFTGNATGRSLHIRKRTTTESSGWHQQLRTPVMGNLTRGSFIIRCLLVEKALEKMCSKFDKISNIYKKTFPSLIQLSKWLKKRNFPTTAPKPSVGAEENDEKETFPPPGVQSSIHFALLMAFRKKTEGGKCGGKIYTQFLECLCEPPPSLLLLLVLLRSHVCFCCAPSRFLRLGDHSQTPWTF